jgi:hypothetical protein
LHEMVGGLTADRGGRSKLSHSDGYVV